MCLCVSVLVHGHVHVYVYKFVCACLGMYAFVCEACTYLSLNVCVKESSVKNEATKERIYDRK